MQYLPLDLSKLIKNFQALTSEFDSLLAQFKSESQEFSHKIDLRLVVLVSSGSFSPIHRMHLQNFELSKQFFERLEPKSVQQGQTIVHPIYRVLGGYIAASSDAYVGGKLKHEAMPHVVRNKLCQLVTADHPWIENCDWGWASGSSLVQAMETIVQDELESKYPQFFSGSGVSTGNTVLQPVVTGILIHGADTIKRMNLCRGTRELCCISRDEESNRIIYENCVTDASFTVVQTPGVTLQPNAFSSFFLDRLSHPFFFIYTKGTEEISSTNARKHLIQSILEKSGDMNRTELLTLLDDRVLRYIESNVLESFPYYNDPKRNKQQQQPKPNPKTNASENS